jgi:CRISPR-associated protein Cas2
VDRQHLVIAYDVTDDRRRARLARFLRGYAARVQKSVFEGEVAGRRIEGLREGIKEEMDQREDSVRLYRLCERCQGAIEVLGTGVYVEDEEEGDVIV